MSDSPGQAIQAPPVYTTKSVVFELVYGKEGDRPPPEEASLAATPELVAVLTRAVAANKDEGGMQLSFDAILIAMVTGDEPLCRWLRDHLALRGVPRSTIGAQRKLVPSDLARGYLERKGREDRQKIRRPQATSSAKDALVTAQRLRDEISGPSAPLDVRHVMAAYAVIPGYHDADFEKLRIDRRAWCLSLSTHLAAAHPREAEKWKTYSEQAAAVILSPFDSDVGARQNLLDIERDVEAFAMLIASRATTTPLSVGIFGPWGSGKTFFLRQLRERIAAIATKARAAESDPAARKASEFHGRIAQVEFNAWHYNESDLVASLVEHIFRNLRFADESAIELESRRNELLSQIAVEKDKVLAVNSEVQTAEAEVATTTHELGAIEGQITQTTTELAKHEQDAEAARTALATLAEPPPAPESSDVDETIGAAARIVRDTLLAEPRVKKFADAIDGASGELRRLQRFVEVLKTPAGIALVAGALLLVFVLPQIVDRFGDTLDQLFGVWGRLVTKLAAVGAALVPAWTWIKARARDVDAAMTKIKEERAAEAERLATEVGVVDEARRKRVEQAQAELDARIAAVAIEQKNLTDSHDALAALRTKLVELGETRAKLEGDKARSEAERERLVTELKRVTYGLLLEEFVSDRSATDHYKKLLGLFARVRNDFEKLSTLMERSNELWYGQKVPRENEDVREPTVSRIVLYIDDLDRCDEKIVARVLQAVHLLLAFPLFVCVVAVDPRWMARCLRKQHPDLIGLAEDPTSPAKADRKRESDDDELGEPATAADYLEKIFQIPMWLRSIPEAQRSAFVHALLRPRAPALESEGGAPPLPLAVGGGGPSGGGNGDGRDERAPGLAVRHESLVIDAEEGELVHRLGALLSTRPRALKRFVNTYRLIKASLTDVELARFVRPGDATSPHRACMIQLAVFTSQRDLAPKLSQKLEVAAASGEDGALKKWLDDLALEPADQWKTVRQAIFTATEDCADMKVAAFARWVSTTQRYAFYVQ